MNAKSVLEEPANAITETCCFDAVNETQPKETALKRMRVVLFRDSGFLILVSTPGNALVLFVCLTLCLTTLSSSVVNVSFRMSHPILNDVILFNLTSRLSVKELVSLTHVSQEWKSSILRVLNRLPPFALDVKGSLLTKDGLIFLSSLNRLKSINLVMGRNWDTCYEFTDTDVISFIETSFEKGRNIQSFRLEPISDGPCLNCCNTNNIGATAIHKVGITMSMREHINFRRIIAKHDLKGFVAWRTYLPPIMHYVHLDIRRQWINEQDRKDASRFNGFVNNSTEILEMPKFHDP